MTSNKDQYGFTPEEIEALPVFNPVGVENIDGLLADVEKHCRSTAIIGWIREQLNQVEADAMSKSDQLDVLVCPSHYTNLTAKTSSPAITLKLIAKEHEHLYGGLVLILSDDSKLLIAVDVASPQQMEEGTVKSSDMN